MKINKQELLLKLLRDDHTNCMSAQELSDKLGVSTRQIRKYVARINEENAITLIYSSNRGYALDPDAYAKTQEQGNEHVLETPETRKNYIVQKLISKNGYDIFDLADELFVSLSTIEADLKDIRLAFREFHLQLRRDRNMLVVEGKEKDRRAFMSHLISSDSYDNFVLKDEVQLLTFHYHFWDFRKNIKDIFAENDIFANDYTLNNTALHLIVMIDRIRNGCIMQEDIDMERVKNTPQYQVSTQIETYIEKTYAVEINDTELYNLILIISNHTTMMDYSFINSDNITGYIEQKYIDIAHNVIRSVEQCYYLDPFDEEFLAKFTIHVKNMFNRVENDYYAKNPLTAKIKTSYPLIYDIAVFIAQEFKRDYGVILNEDEITFIAFHIGSYFEINVQSKNKVTCAFIYADYYSIHKNVMDKIMRQYEQWINMKYAISINSYHPGTIHADLIISTVDMPFPCEHVIIQPFLMEKDMRNIKDAIDRIASKKKNQALKAYLMGFFHSDLFYVNPDFKNKEEAVLRMSEDAASLGFVDEDFHHSVLAREQMSPTVFQDVAIPHSLSKNAKQSFISIALSESGIAWDQHTVHIIAMIAINDDSRKVFAEVFEELINVLNEASNVRTLVHIHDYQQFIAQLIHMMETNRD